MGDLTSLSACDFRICPSLLQHVFFNPLVLCVKRGRERGEGGGGDSFTGDRGGSEDRKREGERETREGVRGGGGGGGGR